jgi:hypothetical protein
MDFPRPGSEGKQEDMQVARAIIKHAGDGYQSDNVMQEEDEEVLAEVIRNETIPGGVGVMDVSEANTLPICQTTRAWLQGLKALEASSQGQPNKHSVKAGCLRCSY